MQRSCTRKHHSGTQQCLHERLLDRRAFGRVRDIKEGVEPTWICPHPDCHERVGLAGAETTEEQGNQAIMQHDRIRHGQVCPMAIRVRKVRTN